ncbi:MAG: hypothetical protein ACM3XM_09485 [Mycobacterium leprae]
MARTLLLIVAVLSTAIVQGSVYRSHLGFQFTVPPGWVARSTEPNRVILVQEEWAELGQEVFVVQTCPDGVPASCLLYPYWPATLTATRQVGLAGRPATEYRYFRRNKPEHWTRQWTEVHTVLLYRGTAYDVAALIRPFLPQEYWRLYDSIRDSFRLAE